MAQLEVSPRGVHFITEMHFFICGDDFKAIFPLWDCNNKNVPGECPIEHLVDHKLVTAKLPIQYLHSNYLTVKERKYSRIPRPYFGKSSSTTENLVKASFRCSQWLRSWLHKILFQNNTAIHITKKVQHHYR